MRWLLLVAFCSLVKTQSTGNALEFGRTLAVSLTRAFSNAPQLQNMPLGSRGTYTGAAAHTVEEGVTLQTCMAASSNDCIAGRGQASPIIFTAPNAVQNLAPGTFLHTIYVILQPAFGLPAAGVSASYSVDLRLLSQGVDAESRSLRNVPMIVQMPYKASDCPTMHAAIGLSPECGVVCMMYDSRLTQWSPVGVTTQTPRNGVVNCSLSTLPANILASQFLSQIRVAVVVDKSANVLQNAFSSSFLEQLARWSGTTANSFRIEALRPFSSSRLDMTRVFLIINSTTTNPEDIFQAIKRVPEGGKVPADPGRGGTQGPLTILMVEKYYTEVPPASLVTLGGAKCFSHADCPTGQYCDEFSNCFSCGPGAITPGYCDSITYDCCSQDFRAQCTNNPYNCSDATSPSAPTGGQMAVAPSSTPIFVVPPSPGLGGRFTASPTTRAPSATPAAVPTPSVVPQPSSPTDSTGQPRDVVGEPEEQVIARERRNQNGPLFRIVSIPQPAVGLLNPSLYPVVDNAFATVSADPASNLTAISLQTQGNSLVTIGEIVSQQPLVVYDALVQQGNNPISGLRREPLFTQITSIRMLCAYGLWRPRCSYNTLENSLNATLILPKDDQPLAAMKPRVVANLEAASGVQDRFVLTDVQQQPNSTFVNFSIVPPELGEPTSESIYDILSHRLPQRKTILVLMNFSNLTPTQIPEVQSALCSLAHRELGLTLTRPDLCNNITVDPAAPQQQWLFSGPITIPLTSAMVIGDNRTFNALQGANNGTALNESDITVLIYDSPLVPLAQTCPAPFIRSPSGVCTSPRGATSVNNDTGLSLLAKILIGVFVGLALCLLLCLCFCCWKQLCCFRKKKKKPKKSVDEPVTNITFIDPTPVKKPEGDTQLRPLVVPERQPKHQHPEISPLHKSSFSHRPISLNEHEGTSRDGFEYDSRSSDECPDSERRSFHFRLEPKPTIPAITPLKMGSPSSTTCMSPSDTVIGGGTGGSYPPFMNSLHSPLPQRRLPPQPRTNSATQPIVFPSPLNRRHESLDAKHSADSTMPRSQVSTPRSLHPSQRQTAHSPPRALTPTHARLGVFQQTLHDQQRSLRNEQTPISSSAFSAPDDDDDDDHDFNTTQEREYSDENRTRHGRSRSQDESP